MPASAWFVFHAAKTKMGDGTFDLDTHTWKCALLNSGWTPSLSGNGVWGDISANGLATNFGYTAGGQNLTGVTWTNAAGTMKFTSANPTWNAAGDNIVARYAAIYNDTDASKGLLCYCLLDTAPADVTAASGSAFVVQMNAAGIFTLA